MSLEATHITGKIRENRLQWVGYVWKRKIREEHSRGDGGEIKVAGKSMARDRAD